MVQKINDSYFFILYVFLFNQIITFLTLFH